LAVVAIILTLMLSGVGLLSPWPVSFLLDGALGSGKVPTWMARLFHRNGTQQADRYFYLYVAVIAQFAVAFTNNALTVVTEYVKTRLEQRMILDFRSDLFEHAMDLSLGYHDQRRSGMLIYIINTAGSAPVQLLMKVPYLLQNVCTVLGMLFILFKLDRQLALVSLAVAPFLYWCVGYYATHIQKRLYEVRSMEGESLSIIHEALSMIRAIMAFGREQYQFRNFRRQGEVTVEARISLTNRQNVFNMVVSIITTLGTGAALLIGARHVLSGALKVGELYVVLQYLSSVYKPLEAISYAVGDLQNEFVSLEMSFEVLEKVPDVRDLPGAVPLPRLKGDLCFEKVDFHYKGREETLRNISFNASAGSLIGIVGPTGAGKSSLVSMLPRFYEITGGKVLLDGIDISGVTLKSLREQIALVAQEPLLFSGTVRENIRYGRLDATDEEVVDAAKAADAHEFILEMPEQYDTILSERGQQLSGGERQRLAIARALVKDAPILILDEPTSAIDAKTESSILNALNRLMLGRTTLMISHRISAIRQADLILVMDHGEIVEHGKHDELLNLGGLYTQLHQLQAGETTELTKAPADGLGLLAGNGALALEEGAAPAVHGPAKVVLLGMMSRWQTASLAWATVQYMEGLRRLGYEVYYVEAPGSSDATQFNSLGDDPAARAAEYIEGILRRFDFGSRWAYHESTPYDRCFGLNLGELRDLYRNAALIINLHGGTNPLPEHAATGRLLCLETDPGIIPSLHNGRLDAFLKAHCAYYTCGLNYGQADCRLTTLAGVARKVTRPVVVSDFWQDGHVPRAERNKFTTMVNWQRVYAEAAAHGDDNEAEKHPELLEFLSLPGATGQQFELAVARASFGTDEADQLLNQGWQLLDGDGVCSDMEQYRGYLWGSRAGFMVAKDRNVRLRSGWFGGQSAQYLAAGRPVMMQETGFSSSLPTGEGLFSFLNLQEILEAVDEVNDEYEKHCHAARELARNYFNYDVVLKPMLADMGL
jgi:ABC-type multidrug transport system fused ATPase/permease subunit